MTALPMFRASNIAALSGWSPLLDSSLLAGWDFSDLSTITQAGGVASQVNDKSANGRNLVQATGAAQPAVIAAARNGRSVGRFDGSNDRMATAAAISSTAITIIFIGKSTKSAGNFRTIASTANGEPYNNGGFDLGHDDRSSNPVAGNSIGFSVNTGITGTGNDKFRYAGKNNGYTDASWVMVGAAYSANDFLLTYNGVDQTPYNAYFTGVGVNAYVASALAFVLGAQSDGTAAASLDVGEVWLYNRRFSAAEFQTFFARWAQPRWAL